MDPKQELEDGEVLPSPATAALAETKPSGHVAGLDQNASRHSQHRTRRIAPGPSPLRGTPQERFMEVVLGMHPNHPEPSRQPFQDTPAYATGLAAPSATPMALGGWLGSETSSYMPPPGGPPQGLAYFGGYPSGNYPASGYTYPSAPYYPAPTLSYGGVGPAPPLKPREQGASQPAMILSLECQKRHFNPEWRWWSCEEGRFGCHVMLNGKLVENNRTYSDSTIAKTATANKALHQVRRMPVYKKEETQEVKEPRRLKREEDKCKKHEETQGKKATTQPAKKDEGLIPEAFINDPLASRAFLEGLRLGHRMRDAESRAPATNRRGTTGNTCSPTRRHPTERGNKFSYRQRSPLRDNGRRWINREHSYDRGYRRDHYSPRNYKH